MIPLMARKKLHTKEWHELIKHASKSAVNPYAVAQKVLGKRGYLKH